MTDKYDRLLREPRMCLIEHLYALLDQSIHSQVHLVLSDVRAVPTPVKRHNCVLRLEFLSQGSECECRAACPMDAQEDVAWGVHTCCIDRCALAYAPLFIEEGLPVEWLKLLLAHRGEP